MPITRTYGTPLTTTGPAAEQIGAGRRAERIDERDYQRALTEQRRQDVFQRDQQQQLAQQAQQQAQRQQQTDMLHQRYELENEQIQGNRRWQQKQFDTASKAEQDNVIRKQDQAKRDMDNIEKDVQENRLQEGSPKYEATIREYNRRHGTYADMATHVDAPKDRAPWPEDQAPGKVYTDPETGVQMVRNDKGKPEVSTAYQSKLDEAFRNKQLDAKAEEGRQKAAQEEKKAKVVAREKLITEAVGRNKTARDSHEKRVEHKQDRWEKDTERWGKRRDDVDDDMRKYEQDLRKETGEDEEGVTTPTYSEKEIKARIAERKKTRLDLLGPKPPKPVMPDRPKLESVPSRLGPGGEEQRSFRDEIAHLYSDQKEKVEGWIRWYLDRIEKSETDEERAEWRDKMKAFRGGGYKKAFK